ncbi:hypothetical protein CK203_088213 [Vitis vinifera]|uniref:Reverse transcriptase domain-containing protein n=1 Tax=Vitis vinifera TaxID=29760 RepID=A0A438FL20_VITVI|nr:hypothetical protein CK203_088213 [Vitis vinifera]
MSKLTIMKETLKPLANDALLEKLLDSKLDFTNQGGDYRGIMDYEKVRGGSTEWEGSALKIVAKALKGPISMILQDGLKVVFLENVSLGEICFSTRNSPSSKSLVDFWNESIRRHSDFLGQQCFGSLGVGVWRIHHFCLRNAEDGFVWVFTGRDLKSIRFLGERNEINLIAEMRRFSKVIEKLRLKDLPLFRGLYNLLAKVLENRLKLVVGKVVSENQHTFIQGRQILDVMLIGSEAVDSRLKNNNLGLLLKLDIEKAYDMSIGIAFFLLCLIWGLGRGGLVGSVNRDKSKVIPVGSIESLKEGVSVMGCKVGKLPTSYLGLPLGASFKSSRVWDVVEERFRKRLFLWKRQYLSKWRRLYLDQKDLIKSSNLFHVSLRHSVEGRRVVLRGVKGGYSVGMWKAIRKEWEGIHSTSCFIVGNGRKMSRCQLKRKARSWVARILTFQDILMIRRWKRWRLAPETLTFGREKRYGGYFELEIKRNLLGWHGAFVGKRREEGMEAYPFMLNLDFMKGKK